MDDGKTVTDTREARVAKAFIRTTSALMTPYDIVELLSTLMATCTDIFGLEAGGILIADVVGDLELVASTSEEASIVETMVIGAGAGPCIDAYVRGEIVTVADIAVDAEEWPQFRSTALAQGFRSVHAVPMRIRGEVVGVMALLGTHAGRLPADDLEAAQSLADIATLGIIHERSFRQPHAITEQLHLALDTRILIEQAKGVLAQSGGLTMDAAFDALRQYARQNELTLREVADRVVNLRIDATVLGTR
jgi:GAF domain-containing protein